MGAMLFSINPVFAFLQRFLPLFWTDCFWAIFQRNEKKDKYLSFLRCDRDSFPHS